MWSGPVRALLLVLLCFTAGCSSGSPRAVLRSTPSPTPSLCAARALPIELPCPLKEYGTKDLTAQGSTVRVTMIAGDTSFDPTFVKVKPGARVTVLADAGGSFPHTFIIDGLGVQESIPGFSKKEFSFTLPISGPVRFYCSLHVRQGMQGSFYFS